MVSVLLFLEENDGHDGGDDGDETTHHLVYGGWSHGQCDKHERRGGEVKCCGDGEQERTGVHLKLLLVGGLGTGGHWCSCRVLCDLARVKELLSSVGNPHGELSNEHKRALHVRVSEVVSVRFGLELGILDQDVGCAEEEHAKHDCISHAHTLFGLILHMRERSVRANKNLFKLQY